MLSPGYRMGWQHIPLVQRPNHRPIRSLSCPHRDIPLHPVQDWRECYSSIPYHRPALHRIGGFLLYRHAWRDDDHDLLLANLAPSNQRGIACRVRHQSSPNGNVTRRGKCTRRHLHCQSWLLCPCFTGLKRDNQYRHGSPDHAHSQLRNQPLGRLRIHSRFRPRPRNAAECDGRSSMLSQERRDDWRLHYVLLPELGRSNFRRHRTSRVHQIPGQELRSSVLACESFIGHVDGRGSHRTTQRHSSTVPWYGAGSVQ